MNAFEPQWATPPGATVLDLLQERGLAVGHLARETHREIHEVSLLLHGLVSLTEDWAKQLARVLGSTPEFWMRREQLYRSDLERLTAADDSVDGWLSHLPMREMVSYGWIKAGSSRRETSVNACAFLGAVNGEAFERKYERLLSTSAYRQTNAFPTHYPAVAAWLRQGEIEASAIDCLPWNSDALRASLANVRALTRVDEPAKFMPELQQLLARCGVAVVAARAPEGCRASGATRFLTPSKAVIQLSFRYLADDQLWFTVFHELGHLLLHAHEKVFLEGLEERNSVAEAEADEFARDALFEEVGVEALQGVNLTKFDIARLAKRAGIAPGIVVGQLQAMERIPYKHFNYMKVRYAWGD